MDTASVCCLFLLELGYPGPLLLGDCGQNFVSCAEDPAHDSCLVFQHRKQQGVADDIQLLVSKVDMDILGDMTQQIQYIVLSM